MTSRTALLLTSLLALAVAGCSLWIGPGGPVAGSGNVKSETRDVHDFDRVALSGVGTLTITQGTSEALTIQAEDNLLPKLQSTVQSGTLSLGPTPGVSINPTKAIRYDLTVKQLKAIDLSGAAQVDAASLSADQLRVGVSGVGRVDLTHITSSTLTVDLSGSGSVTVAGQASEQTVAISGAGRYNGAGLASQRATVDVSGTGNCTVRVSDHLGVSISGIGHVDYIGSPVVDQRVSGLGRVTKTG